MLKLYHAPGTRSVRPLWLCFELGLPLEVETVAFTREYLDSREWRAVSPAGKLPVLRDGELIMFESGAMMEYILDVYGNGRLRPSPGSRESAVYHQWCWFAEATLARPLGLNRMIRAVEAGVVDFAADVRLKVGTCLAVVEDALAHSEYLLPSGFSAADIMMGYSLELIHRVGLLADRPMCLAYLEKLKGRDACVRAMTA